MPVGVSGSAKAREFNKQRMVDSSNCLQPKMRSVVETATFMQDFSFVVVGGCRNDSTAFETLKKQHL
jgi:hypothetical protein